MKQFSQQLHKKAETTVKLQAAERRELKERLVAYMEYHPLPAEMKAKKVVKPAAERIATEAFKTVKVPFHALFKYGAAFAVVVLVAVPFMAEKAVPGDALYAVKVEFNEELRSTLTFDSYQKVEWETERLNRRIAEARLLASEGRLTEAVEAEVAAAVREHTESAKREIEVLRGEDADEAAIASIALDTTLEVQSAALKGDAEVTFPEDDLAGVVQPVNNLIATAIDESRDKTIEPNASTTPPAFNKLMARIEQNTTRIYELHTTLREIAPSEELADVQRRAEDIGRAVTAAVDMVETDEVGARKALVEVLQRTQRLIVFMTELEVTETVDIETLVPVVLTDEEKAVVVASTTAALEAKLAQIEAMLAVEEDVAIAEKALVGQESLVDLAKRMAASTTDFATFTTLSTEAMNLADDMIFLLGNDYVPVELPEEVTTTEEVASSTDAVLPEGGEDLASSTAETATSSDEVAETVDDSAPAESVDTDQ